MFERKIIQDRSLKKRLTVANKVPGDNGDKKWIIDWNKQKQVDNEGDYQ